MTIKWRLGQGDESMVDIDKLTKAQLVEYLSLSHIKIGQLEAENERLRGVINSFLSEAMKRKRIEVVENQLVS